MGQAHHRRHVTEPEAGEQAGQQRLAGVGRCGGRRRGGVWSRWDSSTHSRLRLPGTSPDLEDLQQADRLPCRRAALGVAGDRLLRDRQQRVAALTAELGRDPVVEVALVRVVGAGRRVVLGHHRDVVGRRGRARRAPGRAASPPHRTPMPARPCPGAGIEVWMPSAKLDEYTTTPADGEPGPGRDRRPGEDERATALALDEPGTSAVVGPRELVGLEPGGHQVVGRRGGVHRRRTRGRLRRRGRPTRRTTITSALPARILSTASSIETAAVAQAATGWTIGP